MKGKKSYFYSIATAVSAAAVMLLSSACGIINEDLDPCPGPVTKLRFVYEYNMERANAFHNQVHCLSVFIFDENGKLVSRRNETSEDALHDENYRMTVDLPEGDYHVVAYGGMECENSSFSHLSQLSTGSNVSDIRVSLDPAGLTPSGGSPLHNHFYGAADFSVTDTSTETRVEMMRNTNTIQVALQNISGAPISHEDFDFKITDDNTLFDHRNNLIENGTVTYLPYHTETMTAEPSQDTKADGDTPVSIALARFSTSRIVRAKSVAPTLSVTRKNDGGEVFRIPLSSYMLLFKENHANTAPMGDQEYLDRENSWRFVFFLDDANGTWISTHLIINDWMVRINNTEF